MDEMIVYVNKYELLELLEKKIKEDNERRMAVVDSDFIDLVNDATEINDVAPVVHGEWCVIEDDYRHLSCSACEGIMYTGSRTLHEAKVLKHHWKPYCPNCGAKMDGGRRCAKRL